MNDQLDDAFRDVMSAMQGWGALAHTAESAIGIDKLRRCRASMEAALPLVCEILDAADAAELEEAERKVAELRARRGPAMHHGRLFAPRHPEDPPLYNVAALGIEGDDAPARDPSTLTQAERMRQKWAETDAGRIGAGRVDVDDGTTADEFKGDLHDLRLKTAEKRKRLRG